MTQATTAAPRHALRLAAAVAALMLAACAAPPKPDVQAARPPQSAAPTSAPAAEAPAAPKAEEPVIPEQRNHTPFGMVLLTAEDRFGEYFSVSTKISFQFDARGALKLAGTQEPVIGVDDDPKNDQACTEKGGGYNQRTTWFPDAAIFVRGGSLQAVELAGGKRAALLPLSADDETMMVIGPAAREIEYAWTPCVGRHRVDQGHRLDGFLPRGAALVVKPARGAPLKLRVPDGVVPHLLLRYQEGAMIPVPMRPVLATVDAESRRLVVQYQATFPVRPALRVVELRAVLPDGKASEGETPQRYRERTDALLNDLRACAVPTRPMEPCATPTRRPDRRIYSR
jgi:hypothetical protein